MPYMESIYITPNFTAKDLEAITTELREAYKSRHLSVEKILRADKTAA